MYNKIDIKLFGNFVVGLVLFVFIYGLALFSKR